MCGEQDNRIMVSFTIAAVVSLTPRMSGVYLILTAQGSVVRSHMPLERQGDWAGRAGRAI